MNINEVTALNDKPESKERRDKGSRREKVANIKTDGNEQSDLIEYVDAPSL